MVQLHYAKLDLDGDDILKVEYQNKYEMSNSIYGLVFNNNNNIVYLACYKDEILVTHRLSSVDSFFQSMLDWEKEPDEIIDDYETAYIQEYNSYEAAYEVALDIRETNKLCYEPEGNPFRNVDIKGI